MIERSPLPQHSPDMDRPALRSLSEVLREAALTDPLTGLRNTRYLDSEFSREYDPCRTYAAVVIDIADFGDVNNEHGQDVGDSALQLLAKRAEKHFRMTKEEVPNERRLDPKATDIATINRIGGDEFIVIIDGDHQDEDVFLTGVKSVIDRLSADFEEQSQLLIGDPIRLRVGSVINRKGEEFLDFRLRATKEIHVMKAKLKNQEKVARLADFATKTANGETPSFL